MNKLNFNKLETNLDELEATYTKAIALTAENRIFVESAILGIAKGIIYNIKTCVLLALEDENGNAIYPKNINKEPSDDTAEIAGAEVEANTELQSAGE